MKVIVVIICLLLTGVAFIGYCYEAGEKLEFELKTIGGVQRLEIYPEGKGYDVFLFPGYINAVTFIQIYSVTSVPWADDLITVKLETDAGNTTVVMSHVAGDIRSVTIALPVLGFVKTGEYSKVFGLLQVG